jgi:hypothetical protein
MKRRASYGDVEGSRSAGLKITQGMTGASAAIEWKAIVTYLLMALIVSWNLTDENDQPLTINAVNLMKLDPGDGDFLAAEATKRSELRPQVQEVPFESTSGNS